MTRFDRLTGFSLLLLVITLPISARADEPTIAVPATINTVTLGPEVGSATQGLVSFNIASGTANAQSNSVLVGLGAVDLGEVHASVNTSGSAAATNSAVISPHAFTGSAGVVQINATAGTGNTSSNAFSFNIIPAGGH